MSSSKSVGRICPLLWPPGTGQVHRLLRGSGVRPEPEQVDERVQEVYAAAERRRAAAAPSPGWNAGRW